MDLGPPFTDLPDDALLEVPLLDPLQQVPVEVTPRQHLQSPALETPRPNMLEVMKNYVIRSVMLPCLIINIITKLVT